MPRRRHSHRRGLTLIDLTVVVVITAVAAALAVPRYAGAVADFRAAQAAQRVAADLALARWTARSTSTPAGVTVAFDVAANAYTIPGVPGPTGPASAYTVSLAADPYAARVASASFGGAASVTFDRYGQPAAGGTVVVAVGAVQRTVTLDATSGLASVGAATQ